MSSNAKFGYGTLVKMGDGGAPEVFTAIAELRGDIEFSGLEADEIEVTTHNNAVNGKAKEKILGLIDPGTVNFEINYVADDATHLSVQTAWLNQVKHNFQLRDPFGHGADFSGYIKSFPRKYPTGDSITAKLSIMVTGIPTFV